MRTDWERYCDYLKIWADDHRDDMYESNEPVSYDEWYDNDRNVCQECSNNDCEEVHTISEWCDELGYTDNEDYLYNLADEQAMATEICRDCFDSLIASSGL